MKNLTTLLLFISFSSYSYSQSGMGTTPGFPDPHMSPMSDYGGALGGANNSTPSSTTPTPTTPSSRASETIEPTPYPQEQQESNVLGGAREGVIDSPTSRPSTINARPETPPTEAAPPGARESVYPAGSGTGTGIGTGVP